MLGNTLNPKVCPLRKSDTELEQNDLVYRAGLRERP
jgi:hypothetical protein